MAPSFHVLEDVAIADVAFEAVGKSPSDLCIAAAQAVVETMVDPNTVAGTWRQSVDLQHEQFAELLFAWLSEIVYWKDVGGVVFGAVSATVSGAANDWRLHGELVGAAIDPAHQDLRCDVKAVTKHLYHVREEQGQWKATVVLDI